jgi:hypothetical protein
MTNRSPFFHSSPPDVPLRPSRQAQGALERALRPDRYRGVEQKVQKGTRRQRPIEGSEGRGGEGRSALKPSQAAPAAPFKSALQSELFALMDTYKDVTYTARAPPGTTRKEPVNSDGSAAAVTR